MADIKKIAETLADLSPQEVEILRHAQVYDVPVVKKVVVAPPSETKWWKRFEKRKKH